MQHHGQPEAVTRAIGEFVCPSRRAAWVRGAADLKELRVSISPAFRTHRRLACGHTIDCASPWSIDMDTLRIVRWLALSLSLVAVNPVNAANHTIFFTDYCQSAPLCFQPDRMTIAIGDSVTFRFACEMLCASANVVADDGSFRCANGCDDDGGDGNPAGGYRSQGYWVFTRMFNTPGLVRFHDEVSKVAGLVFVVADNNRTVVEFHHAGLGNYFITSDPAEQAYVDTGAVGAWQRTGGAFRAGGPIPVCRFIGNPYTNPATGRAWGPNSHFYTADARECEALRATGFNVFRKSWKLESYDFAISPATNTGCAEDQVPVYRAYNDGFTRGVDSNHRITSDEAAYRATVASGWIGEGVVMCAQQ